MLTWQDAHYAMITLNQLTKDSVIELIPDGVTKNNFEFWQCKSCKKIVLGRNTL